MRELGRWFSESNACCARIGHGAQILRNYMKARDGGSCTVLGRQTRQGLGNCWLSSLVKW